MNPIRKQIHSYSKIPLFLSGFYGLLTLYSSKWFISDAQQIPNRFIERPGTFFLNHMSPEIIQLLVNISPLVFFLTCIRVKDLFLRILSFLFCYFSVAYLSSQGSSAYTELLTLIWMSFFAIFCQFKYRANIGERYRDLLIFHLVVGSLILPYILAGFWKLIYGGVYQLFFDEMTIWHPNALLYTMNTYLLRIESTSWLQGFLNNNPYLLWFSLAYITLWEIALPLVFWYPEYWKKVCFQIIIFHFVVIWMLDILFYPQLGLFLLLYFINPLDGEAPKWAKFTSD